VTVILSFDSESMASNFFKINQVQGNGHSELYSESMTSNLFKTLNQVQGDGHSKLYSESMTSNFFKKLNQVLF